MVRLISYIPNHSRISLVTHFKKILENIFFFVIVNKQRYSTLVSINECNRPLLTCNSFHLRQNRNFENLFKNVFCSIDRDIIEGFSLIH